MLYYYVIYAICTSSFDCDDGCRLKFFQFSHELFLIPQIHVSTTNDSELLKRILANITSLHSHQSIPTMNRTFGFGVSKQSTYQLLARLLKQCLINYHISSYKTRRYFFLFHFNSKVTVHKTKGHSTQVCGYYQNPGII